MVADLQRERDVARQLDQQTRPVAERTFEQEVAEARERLERVRSQIHRVREDPSNYRETLTLWGALSGAVAKPTISKHVARQLIDLEDEEYFLEVRLGYKRPPSALGREARAFGLRGLDAEWPDKEHVEWLASQPKFLERWPELQDGRFRQFMQRRAEHHRGIWDKPSTKWEHQVSDCGPIILYWSSQEEEVVRRIKRLSDGVAALEAALGAQEEKLAQLESFKARALQTERDLARRLRLSFIPSDDCPYCGNPIGTTARLDHIYPVSKGGLSTRSNLVFVCFDCNQKKSDMTLSTFVRRWGLDRGIIEDRLTSLGKEF
jgi:5-methylcytosine-specific restriction endonuclease McrA